MPTKPRTRGLTPGIIALLIVVAVGVFVITKRLPPLAPSPGCEARSGHTVVSLDTQQAAIAATIAGVAHHRDMPVRAVQIAYAAALQESKLHNLRYGDRDSVGVFQQRPSEGWGPTRRLLDPVYATTRFFRVLSTVPNYRHLPVYQAAQAVQRSADGSAYRQYEPMAAQLASAFTGQAARAVWCRPGQVSGSTDLVSARRELLLTFGPVASHRIVTPKDAPTMVVRAGSPQLGWSLASWLVTHAATYGIHEVRYAGYQWRDSSTGSGWARDANPPPAGRVEAG